MKAKLKRICTITALLVGLLVNLSHGQAYTVKTFDGNSQVVRLIPDYEKRILTMKCANAIIHIRDVDNIDTVQVLNKSFLLITYRVRAGAGLEAAKTLILSASNHAMFESLHVTSLFKEDFLDFRKPTPPPMKASVKTIYQVDLCLTGSNIDDYNIKVKFHDGSKSIDELKGNYDSDLAANLNFDRNKNIFYSSQEHISQSFTIIDAKTGNISKQYINGVFPVIILGKYKYYYKNGGWYEWSDGNYLTQESYR